MASLREMLEQQKAAKAAASKAASAPQAPSQIEIKSEEKLKTNGGGFLSRKFEASAPANVVPQMEQKPQVPAKIETQTIITKLDNGGTIFHEEKVGAIPAEGVATLRKNLEYLAANIEQKELVGQVVRTIAVQLKENPQFSSSMTNGDFNLLVRGLRRAYNVAALKKTEGDTKRAKAVEGKNELEQMMKDVGLSFNLG